MAENNGKITPQQFLGKPRTAGYSRAAVLYDFHAQQSNRLLLSDIDEMLRDETIQIGFFVIDGPVRTAKWTIQADGPVQQFVDAQLKRFWQQDLFKALQMLRYGSAGGEVTYERNHVNGMMEYKGLKDIHLEHLRVLQDVSAGECTSLKAKNIPGRGDVILESPRMFWVANEPVFGSPYGRSRLIAAKAPWLEKSGKKGAVANRRLWCVKNAFGGGIIRFPDGMTVMPDGRERSNQEVARELLEKMEAGAVIALPNDRDPETKEYLWTYEPPVLNGDGKTLNETVDKLDIAITKGMGIMPEVVQAGDKAGGWSGRSVPFVTFLTSEDGIVDTIIRAWKKWIGDPLVKVNYGSEEYKIEPVSLLQQGGSQQSEGSQDDPNAKQPDQGQNLGEIVANSGGNPQRMLGAQQDTKPVAMSLSDEFEGCTLTLNEKGEIEVHTP